LLYLLFLIQWEYKTLSNGLKKLKFYLYFNRENRSESNQSLGLSYETETEELCEEEGDD